MSFKTIYRLTRRAFDFLLLERLAWPRLAFLPLACVFLAFSFLLPLVLELRELVLLAVVVATRIVLLTE